MFHNAMGGGGVSVPGKKRYEGVWFNIISVTRGWVGVKFPGKKHNVTLEWPLTSIIVCQNMAIYDDHMLRNAVYMLWN